MLLETPLCAGELTDQGMEVERRAVVRYLCDHEASYYELPKCQRRWARVRNISTAGIGLVLCAPIDPGTDLVIEMKTMDPDTSLILPARVVHATMQEEGSWIVGCKLLSKLAEEDLLALL
jgi:PilZ domain